MPQKILIPEQNIPQHLNVHIGEGVEWTRAVEWGWGNGGYCRDCIYWWFVVSKGVIVDVVEGKCRFGWVVRD